MKRILIVPPLNDWYMEVHAEYLVRYLSDEFFIEVADVPYPPYKNFLDRFPETNPFQRSPDGYDLVWPLLPTHWVITEKDKYAHKVATVFYEPNEGRTNGVAVVGACTPLAEKSLEGKKYYSLRFGIDTELFKPLNFPKDKQVCHSDKKTLNVGVVGALNNPRRILKELFPVIKNIPGVRLMLFPSHNLPEFEIEKLGGREILKNIVAGDKSWPGIANLYNRLDVLIRSDIDPGYSFPTLEAASCGIAVVATDCGIDHFITEAGGGILIKADQLEANGNTRAWYQANIDKVVERVRDAIIWLRDHRIERQKMGIRGRNEILKNWRWKKFTGLWREFFNEGIKNANRNSR